MTPPPTPIVSSLLENDLYKFTMWQALLHSNPGAQAEYRFVCRNTPAFPLAELKQDVERELAHLCSMHFTQDELDYLSQLRFMKSDFVDFLSVFRFQQRFIDVRAVGDKLEIVARGPLVHVMGFEIFVLYIVNELYFRRLPREGVIDVARSRLEAKLAQLGEGLASIPANADSGDFPFMFFDFGCVAVTPARGTRKSCATCRARHRIISVARQTFISPKSSA